MTFQSNKQETESQYSLFGTGGWIEDRYILKECPLCNEEYSFHFQGLTGQWRCTSCNKAGDTQNLKEILKDDLFLMDRIAELQQPGAPEGLINVGTYIPPKRGASIASGFSLIDQKLSGLYETELTIISGKRGEGKSTIAGQFALNVINAGGRVCFYSGELNAGMFQSWTVSQAAGSAYMNKYIDPFGADRYTVDAFIEQRIKSWLKDRLILYDNSIKRASERNSILERFLTAKKYYGCNVFFVDNLMTAKYTKDGERDYFRQQSNFAGELVDFAHQEHAHVILLAHPKKGDTGDDNDNVAGLSDITNRASNVFTIHRLTPDERKREDFDSLVTISKNRNYGALAKLGFNFDIASKRFIPISGTVIERYGWEGEL